MLFYASSIPDPGSVLSDFAQERFLAASHQTRMVLFLDRRVRSSGLRYLSIRLNRVSTPSLILLCVSLLIRVCEYGSSVIFDNLKFPVS
jgi:hypothetical protein